MQEPAMTPVSVSDLTDAEVIDCLRLIVADDRRKEAESLAALPPW